MSIDLEWSKLDSSLASHLVNILNRQIENTSRPSFIGPVEVTSLEFGTAPPEVELIDLRDIYRDFLEDDEDENDLGPVKVTEGAPDDDGFEWVSRRAAGREELSRSFSFQHQHLPPHVRATDLSASTPNLPYVPRDIWNSGLSLPSFRPDFHVGYTGAGYSTSLYRSPSPATPFLPQLGQRSSPDDTKTSSQTTDPAPNIPIHDTNAEAPANPLNNVNEQASDQQLQNQHPNLQLHFHINWHSNLRITLTTSLLINYPSPMFMCLPIKLSVTGLFFNGELVVAYEGERKRVHVCIVDDLDPYAPAGDRSKRNSLHSPNVSPDIDEESSPSGAPSRPNKPLPIGQRLLPSIYIESEIGQADKHVLKNVTRVERFIQDVIRRTIEEELVFPNFHTLLLGEQ